MAASNISSGITISKRALSTKYSTKCIFYLKITSLFFLI